MNAGGYGILIRRFHDAANVVAQAKGKDYTGQDEDVLKNFKTVAERAGLKPLQVWMVFFLKQVDAIASAVKFPDSPPSEPISQRFIDLHNYTNLGLALFLDEGYSGFKSDAALVKWATLTDADREQMFTDAVKDRHAEGDPVVDDVVTIHKVPQ